MAVGVPTQLRPIPVWSPRWSPEALQRKHEEEEGPFVRGYFMIATADGDLTFPSFDSCCVRGLNLDDLQRNNWPAFTGVDLSRSKRPGVAIITIKVNPLTQLRYPVDARVGAWKANEIADQLTTVNNLFNPEVIMVEDNGAQQFLIDYIQVAGGSYGHKVEPTTTTGQSKSSQEFGLPVLQVEFRNKAWVLPADEIDASGTLEELPWKRFGYEFRNHPTAATTDMMMATWFARQGAEKFGYTREALRGVRHSMAR